MSKEKDNTDDGLRQRLIEKKLNHRSDERAGNGGLACGQRTVRNDKSVYFDGGHYFSHQLAYYLRQRVWVCYADGNMKHIVNVYTRPAGRLICTIDNTQK